MSTNMTLIEAKTLASATASVTFSSIPQTYTDLLLKVSVRSTTTNDWVGLYFNGSTADVSGRIIQGTGSSVSSSTSNPAIQAILSDNSSFTASTFGNAEVYIPNYTSNNAKSFSIDTVTENNATTAYMQLLAGLWNPATQAAITSITLVASSGDMAINSTFYLYGISNVTSTTKATGGIVSSDGTYNYHMFPYSGTFTPTQNISVDYLVIAGGGGAGFSRGGGGGAGGLRSTVGATGGGGSLESALSLTANTGYTVTVGAGGAGGTSGSSYSSSGSNSVFSTITSTGGGKGADANENNQATGGSGGGRQNSGTVQSGTTNQGYAGGNGQDGPSNAGGGGGGAGAVGGNASSGIGGNGGAGVQITTFATATQTGANNGYYAGGGGGGRNSAGTPSTGGIGGGGNGGGTADQVGFAGIVNTGGGGGGGANATVGIAGGAGGSGLVIIRYAI